MVHSKLPDGEKNNQLNVWFLLIVPLILVVTTALIYKPSLQYDFQFDDIANISKHFEIRSHTLSDMLFQGTRWISYWLNSFYYSLDKFNPFYYRLGNIIIHTKILTVPCQELPRTTCTEYYTPNYN